MHSDAGVRNSQRPYGQVYRPKSIGLMQDLLTGKVAVRVDAPGTEMT